MNLLTRLNWEWRVAASGGTGPRGSRGGFRQRLDELADYLLFVGEATPVVAVTPRPGFAEQLLAAVPKDRYGRSLAELDLTTRLMRYPLSYMVYTEAFDGLAPEVKAAVYERLFTRLRRPRSRSALRPPADAGGAGGRGDPARDQGRAAAAAGPPDRARRRTLTPREIVRATATVHVADGV